MTKTEIITEVADRLNLTSAESLARINRAVDRLYRALTTSVGLIVTRNVEASVNTVAGTYLMTVPSMEKVISLRPPGDDVRPLDELTEEEVRKRHPGAGRPTAYAVYRMNARSVEVLFDKAPTDVEAFTATGQTTVATLGANDEPAFPESFHDALIEGILKDEYRKLEKMQLASASKGLYDERVSELRLWVAKSVYLEIMQGKEQSRPALWRRQGV